MIIILLGVAKGTVGPKACKTMFLRGRWWHAWAATRSHVRTEERSASRASWLCGVSLLVPDVFFVGCMVHTCMCVHVHIWLLWVYVCTYVDKTICICFYSVCLFVCMFVCWLICLLCVFVGLLVCWFVCLLYIYIWKCTFTYIRI